MSEAPHATITVDGVTLILLIQRKRVKNVNARLLGNTMSLSVPIGMSQETLEPIILDLARKLVRRAHARQVNEAEDARELARRVATRFPEPPEIAHAIFVTTQEARWASYSSVTGTIRLSAVLRRMPRWVLEAVVAHELAHVTHGNHSPAFWDLARRACPDTDRAREFLAGVSWLGHHWEELPAVERALLTGVPEYDEERG